jgi:hypothetical protein
MAVGVSHSTVSMLRPRQDKLEAVDDDAWRRSLYSLAFLHAALMERRRFSSLGWCQTYDFNTGDLTASLAFLEKHFLSCGHASDVSWVAVQFMAAEVSVAMARHACSGDVCVFFCTAPPSPVLLCGGMFLLLNGPHVCGSWR